MKEFISCNQTELFGDCDSVTIQNAVQAAIEDGCRKVVIPRYNLRADRNEWRIDTAIELPSNITIILDNCRMVQETGCYDNMFRNKLAYEGNKTLEDEQHDISILGVGNVCLSGGEHNGLLERNELMYGLPTAYRNQMLLWINVRNLRVENLHIEHQRHWAITHIYCRNVKIKNIDFYAIPHVPNMDGIDLRVGCRDFEMENITGRTGDDTIAMTAIATRMENASQVEGKPTDICNVKLRNVVSDANRMLNVRVLTQDGIQVHDIDIDTIMDTSDYKSKNKAASTLGIGTQGMLYVEKCLARQDDTRNITAKNIYSRAFSTVRIDDVCSDSTFTNLHAFNTCFLGMSTVGMGCSLKNITMDGFYYSSLKSDSQRGWVDGYSAPTVVHMRKTKGDLLVKNVHAYGAEYLCRAKDGLHVRFENCDMTNIANVCKGLGESKITINGEEYQGD